VKAITEIRLNWTMYVRAGIFSIFKATMKEEGCNALLF
jgi:hypothetical protein